MSLVSPGLSPIIIRLTRLIIRSLSPSILSVSVWFIPSAPKTVKPLDLSMVPQEYHNLNDVFSKELAILLPTHLLVIFPSISYLWPSLRTSRLYNRLCLEREGNIHQGARGFFFFPLWLQKIGLSVPALIIVDWMQGERVEKGDQHILSNWWCLLCPPKPQLSSKIC